MGSLLGGKKPKPTPPPEIPAAPAPVEQAVVDAADVDALSNVKDRAAQEKARRGRNRLVIPMAGASGGSGLYIP